MPPPSTEGPSLGHPLFLLNLKAYPGHLGPAAVRIAKLLEALGKETGVATAIAPPVPDLAWVAASVGIPVVAQHVDPGDAGARTGDVPVESIEAAEARGSLVNHSEHPMTIAEIEDAVRRLSALAIVAVVCAADVPRARRLVRDPSSLPRGRAAGAHRGRPSRVHRAALRSSRVRSTPCGRSRPRHGSSAGQASTTATMLPVR